MGNTPKSVYFEDLSVGQEASHSSTVTADVIRAFADVSGDRNPVHVDAEYAATTMFKERIAHGMLSAAYISAVFGMQLPGPGAIYISQTLNFKAPVRIGDTVVAAVEVAELIADRLRVRLICTCKVEDTVVLEGDALVKVPRREAVGSRQ